MPSLEEQIRAHKELSNQIAELEAKRKELGAAILSQMKDKVLQVSDYIVRRFSRLVIKTSLKDARLLDMVKMQEVIDKERIKTFHAAGHTIPGVTEFQYIQVSQTNTSTNSS